MNWCGDYPEDFANVAIYFTTHDGNGAPVAPLSAFEADDVKIYKDGSATQKTSTNGLTMTSPFDSLTGVHRLLIDTSNDTGDTGFWVAGHVYTVVLDPDTETVNGQTIRQVVATFGIALAGASSAPSAATIADAVWDEARSGHVTSGSFGEGVASVQGAVTGAVASVTGNVGGNVTGSVGSVVGAVGSVTGNVGGNVTGSVGSVASGGITAASIASDAITAAKIADGAIDAATFAANALDAVWSTATRVLTAGTNIQLPSNGLANVSAWTVAITGNITGNLSGSVGSVSGNVTGSIGSLATQAKADVNAEADTALADAGVTTTVTGRIDAAISTRLATGGYTAPPSASSVADEVWSSSRNATLNSLIIQNTGSGPAVQITSTDDHGMLIEAGYLSNHDGLKITGVNGGHGIYAVGGTNGSGMKLQKGGSAVYDLNAAEAIAVIAVQTQTDQLVFTKPNELDVNIQSVNGVTVNGDGSATKWGP